MRVPATPVVESVDIREKYDVEHAKLVGKGGFSHVVAVRHRPSNAMRALKVMNREILKGKVAEMVVHEQEILRRISHPNIIKLHETINTPHHVYFSLDLMGGDLFALIVRNRSIPEGAARLIMYQLLCGIQYLHSQCIVHRDIKPENVLLNITRKVPKGEASAEKGWEKTLNIEVKLADFGLAKLVQEWDVKSTPCGTSFYIAPEVIRGIEAQGTSPLCTTQQLVKSVDVWSAGVVLFVMLSGRPPFHGQVTSSEERRRLLQRINGGVLFQFNQGWDRISEEAKDLIVRMLEQDSTRRLTAMEALSHPFFTNHGFKAPQPPGSIAVAPQEKPQKQKEEDGGAAVQETAKAADEEETRMPISAEQAEKGWKAGDEPAASGEDGTEEFMHMFSHKNRDKPHSDTGSQQQQQPSDADAEADDEESEEKRLRSMQAEIDALQKDIVEAGDVEGDHTSYKQTIPLMTAPHTKRPAVMNANAKVNPSALKR